MGRKSMLFSFFFLTIFSFFSFYLTFPVKAATVDIYPGTNINDKIKTYGAGTTFKLKAGTHRMQTIKDAQSGDQFIGEVVNGQKTVLNGSKTLNGFQKTTYNGKTVWYIGNQTQTISQHPTSDPYNGMKICQDGWSRCRYRNEVFINSVRQKHVGSLNDIGSGSWFFDDPNNRLYIGTDPNGKTTEYSETKFAFQVGWGEQNIRVKNLVIEKYANDAQSSALTLYGSNNIIEYNEVRLNHGAGIAVGFAKKDSNNKMILPLFVTNTIVQNNIIRNNGFAGIGGTGQKITFQNNEIAYNNEARFSIAWDGGGGKTTYTDGLVVKNNYSHHNYGNGFWSDVHSIRATYDGNISVYNDGSCIEYEISSYGTIKNNFAAYCKKSQIYSNNSKYMTIDNNKVIVDPAIGETGKVLGLMVETKKRGENFYWPVNVEQVNVTNNSIYLKSDKNIMAGLFGEDVNTSPKGVAPFDVATAAKTTKFNYNKYYTPSSTNSRWAWGGWGIQMGFDCFKKQKKNCAAGDPVKMEQNGSVTTSGYTIPSVPAFNVVRGPQP